MLGPSEVCDHFREQAGWCAGLGSPFTAQLLERFADDYNAGGAVADLCGGWATNPRKDALGLRLAGALYHAVLSGASESLAYVYPQPNRAWDMAEIWPLVSEWLTENILGVRAFVQRPPQTNETRRAIALLPGFLEIAAQFHLPLNLLELGASAGLNMSWDQFSYHTRSWSRLGDGNVVVETDWRAARPAHLDTSLQIMSRAACDQNPLNIHDPAERLRLRSYIWPDQFDRLARFDAAADLAQVNKVHVEQGDALAWLTKKLAARPAGVTTVIYHSVFLQYPPRDVIDGIFEVIERAGKEADTSAPLAWLCFEPEALFGGALDSSAMVTRLQLWPGASDQMFLLRSNGHVTFVEPAGTGR